ncbi:MAG: methenyltetrahydromethanopterin cyclohydrolase [Planctomycetota bacterium]
MNFPSAFNAQAKAICDQAVADASLGIEQTQVGSATLINFAPDKKGTANAGLALAKICLGGQTEVSLQSTMLADRPLVEVQVDAPLWPCMGCQYAGWPLSVDKFFAMASGPVRLLRGQESVLTKYNLREQSDVGVVVLESSKLPDENVFATIANEAGLQPSQITVCVAPTSSIPGSLQVVARSVETALHKLYELKFDLASIISGKGTAPLPPETDDDLIALGWTNDAVLYGGNVELVVDTHDETIQNILESIPSCSSHEFGKPFIDLFRQYEYDFYKIDPHLFSPARITIENRKTGNRFSAGDLHEDILRVSFGQVTK